MRKKRKGGSPRTHTQTKHHTHKHTNCISPTDKNNDEKNHVCSLSLLCVCAQSTSPRHNTHALIRHPTLQPSLITHSRMSKPPPLTSTIRKDTRGVTFAAQRCSAHHITTANQTQHHTTKQTRHTRHTHTRRKTKHHQQQTTPPTTTTKQTASQTHQPCPPCVVKFSPQKTRRQH